MSEAPDYTFGMSEFTTWPWTFEQDVDRYAHLGVQTMEVCEFKLDQRHIQEQAARVREAGMQISSIQPAVRTLFPSQSQPEPVPVPDRTARFRQTIESFGEFARDVPFVTNTGNPPDGNMQLVLETAVTEYRALARFAADRGARIAFEPLNPTIMNVESTIWTLEQGLALVDAVDQPNFGICLDVWNVWQNPAIEEWIRRCGDRIFVVQLSDWRVPRSYQDRLIPGDGSIPLARLLRAIYDSGFRGALAVEIFSGGVPDSLWHSDLEEVVRRSREGVDRAWREAFDGI